MRLWSDAPARECELLFHVDGWIGSTEATAAGCVEPSGPLSASLKRSTGLTCDTVPSAQAVNTSDMIR